MVIRDAMAGAFFVFDAVLRTGGSLYDKISDPYRSEQLGDLEVWKFEDGSVGWAAGRNSQKDQTDWLNSYNTIYGVSVNNYNEFYKEYINAQEAQLVSDYQLADAINQAKRESYEQTQAVFREQDRLEKERLVEISVLETDKANREALEKLLPKSVSRAPVISSDLADPKNMIIASAIVLAAFALR